MNRQILFRGKRADNGEWVISKSIFQCINGLVQLTVGESQNVYVDIDPSTVGQFTGLLDKNGKKVFEGDIIALAGWSRGGYCEHPNDGDECAVHAKIVFNEWNFILKLGNCYENLELTEDYFKIYDGKIDGEIIGNIHDNPELLEVSGWDI